MTTIVQLRIYIIVAIFATNYSHWNIKLKIVLTHSEIWSVIDSFKVVCVAIDVNAIATWKLKDSKAQSDIFSIVEKNSLFC